MERVTDREQIVAAFAWNLRYAEDLVSDLTDAESCEPAGPGLENHPAWTLGHLVSGADLLAEDLGLEREMSPRWRELFERRGPGDPRMPDPDPASYPPIRELIGELRRQHERIARQWLALSDEELAAPEEWRFDGEFPTTGGAALFMAVTHEALHLGQLAAWRRARGLPSALARMPRG
ncbi:MAG: DinB family protein [Planctomycetota bacterium]